MACDDGRQAFTPPRGPFSLNPLAAPLHAGVAREGVTLRVDGVEQVVDVVRYLSVLVTPRFAPARLVIDPDPDYFWLSCTTATANEEADRSVPAESRRLVRVHACLHR